MTVKVRMKEFVRFVVKYTPFPAAVTRIKEVIILPTFNVNGIFAALNASQHRERASSLCFSIRGKLHMTVTRNGQYVFVRKSAVP